ncbi:hypothetical protein I3842_15G098000 [Carya illinoinensis]|uniref:Uncharacterized protein n=1 Tax=Carya illinoinensis TaxID=32201 RepID=A0A922AD08_CARIL|nr:hypothetical protein I3842_15G098000 [Carya illinoinensis]
MDGEGNNEENIKNKRDSNCRDVRWWRFGWSDFRNVQKRKVKTLGKKKCKREDEAHLKQRRGVGEVTQFQVKRGENLSGLGKQEGKKKKESNGLVVTWETKGLVKISTCCSYLLVNLKTSNLIKIIYN